MSLPIRVIERLFQRLTATYGTEFVNKWDKMVLVDIKTAWAHELAFCHDDLNMIGWALENLPAKCPNLIEFKNLCKQAPRIKQLALDAPKADPEIVDAEIRKIVSSAFKPMQNSNFDHKAWGKKLKAIDESVGKLNSYQVYCYKRALAA